MLSLINKFSKSRHHQQIYQINWTALSSSSQYSTVDKSSERKVKKCFEGKERKKNVLQGKKERKKNCFRFQCTPSSGLPSCFAARFSQVLVKQDKFKIQAD
jgi:hypothetical protein